MADFKPDESLFSSLRDKVVVLTGGATGIGASIVRILAKNGARVVFGDINSSTKEGLGPATLITFVQCDVTNYNDICGLFRTAFEQHGRIDHAVSCAGIFEQGNWFDPELTMETVQSDPGNSKVLDVNVVGTLNFCRVAAVYFRENSRKGENKSLTLLSSTSKHAIQGILRSSRKILYERDGIRVNAVCPGVTDTPMAAHVVKPFQELGLFTQPAESVANVVVGLQVKESMNGKAIYVEGGDAWELEDSFYDTQPQ